MQYLTLENVMIDAVGFIDSLKANHSIPEDTKVLVTSGEFLSMNDNLKWLSVLIRQGSYGGFIAAMLRLNHPETFVGCLDRIA